MFLLVTTKHLDEVVVHPEGWARVGAGVKWLRVVEAAAPFGLAPLSGSITDVGIVGYTTGGGLGPMARTYGLAIDKVRANNQHNAHAMKMVDYLDRPREQFARAYSQWVLMRTPGAEAKKALDALRKDAEGAEQWADDDFAPIAKALEKLLGEVYGLLK